MVSVISETRQLETRVCSLEVCPPQYKRREVSAVRDFPPGCGPNAAQINMEKKEVEGGGQKVGQHSKDVKSSGFPVCSSSSEKATSSVVKSKNVEQGSEELPKLPVAHGFNGILKELIIENPKSSQDLQKVEEESIMKHAIHDTSKELVKVGVESPIGLENTIVPGLNEAGNDIQSEVVVEGSTMQLYLLPHHPIPCSLVWKEREYPPRRRVSAARDFPPMCGSYVKQLIDDENKHLGQEKTDVNALKGNFEADDYFRNKIKGVVCGKTGDNLEGQFKSDKDACAEVIMRESQFGKLDVIRGEEEMHKVHGGEQHRRLMERKDYNGIDKEDMGGSTDGVNKEIIVYAKDKHKKKKSGACVQIKKSKVVVQGLMAAPNHPRRRVKKRVKSSPSTSNVKQSKREKHDHAIQDQHKCSFNKNTDSSQNLEERSNMIMPYLKGTEAEKVHGDNNENEELSNDLPADVTRLPLDAGSSSERGVRSKVQEILRTLQFISRKLLQEEAKAKDETKLKDKENVGKMIDLRVAEILKAHGKCVDTGKRSIIGPIPGVEVGDFFHFRMELSIIGLHCPPQAGIHYIKQGGRIIATSIVASGGYANDVDSSDVLIYTGQGGKAKSGEPEDQKLERGNLALKNSIDDKNVIRVIRGFKETKPTETADGKRKIIATYTYDGLYTVEKLWRDLGLHGKFVYKFELRRLSGQPELAWKEVKRSKKFQVREGRCIVDISGGKETFPICAVNTIDDDKPPEFMYITSMVYTDWCQPLPPRYCDCKDGCSDSGHCSCAVKNGGEIPYNYNGEIFRAKPLVYECGPYCKCPPTCHNRVSQYGIKFPFEIFKTGSRGWGVRCLSSIPSGSFICEYIGELLDDKEAEQRTGRDEYLFDIGKNFNDPTLWNGFSNLMPDLDPSSGDVVENVGFTIDAAKYGNVARFINHSCSPNLYAQNVLYDHDDKRIPHIMLFAAENIPPLQELNYDYNYSIDQVFDSDGNIKKKSCYCGSSECTGWMY